MTISLLTVALVLLVLIDAEQIRAALRFADISITKAALWMEMDRPLLERQLNGEGHLRHTALLKLPLKFWQWYSVLMVEQCGLPTEIRRAAPMQLALMARKRMARIERAS